MPHRNKRPGKALRPILCQALPIRGRGHGDCRYFACGMAGAQCRLCRDTSLRHGQQILTRRAGTLRGTYQLAERRHRPAVLINATRHRLQSHPPVMPLAAQEAFDPATFRTATGPAAGWPPGSQGGDARRGLRTAWSRHRRPFPRSPSPSIAQRRAVGRSTTPHSGARKHVRAARPLPLDSRGWQRPLRLSGRHGHAAAAPIGAFDKAC